MINTSKIKIPVMILSIVALVGAAIKSVSRFFHYDYSYYPGKLKLTPFTEIEFSQFLIVLITLSAFALMLIYSICFFGKPKKTFVLAIVCLLFALLYLYYFVLDYEFMLDYLEYLIERIIDGNIRFSIIIDFILMIQILTEPLVAIAFLLLAINAFIGFRYKALTIAPIIFIAIIELLSVTYLISYFLNKVYFYMLSNTASIISIFALLIAILLIGLSSKKTITLTPVYTYAYAYPYSTASAPVDMSFAQTPEQALKSLKYQFDCGMISAEEYQRKRVEIINKL